MILPRNYTDYYPPTEVIELFPLVARTAVVGAVSASYVNPGRVAFMWLLELTAAADDVDDTLDVYIDTLVGTTWINIAHFTQILGNGADAIVRFVIIVPGNMLTTDVATADCAAGVARPAIGSQYRGRYTIVDGGGADATFTFSLMGLAM